MNTLENALNQQLANWNVLYVKLHNYHWYVKGLNFFTLHEKFEQFYNDASTNLDEISERILTIGGMPIATLREYLEVTTLTEGNRELNAIDMVADLIADYEIIVSESKIVINLAEENDDEETADLFRDKICDIQKQLWMLKAFIG